MGAALIVDAGDVVAVPLEGLKGMIETSKGVELGFDWYEPESNEPVLVSGTISVIQ